MVVFDHNLDPWGSDGSRPGACWPWAAASSLARGCSMGYRPRGEYSGSLPFRYTDFIFSAIGEELGMLGVLGGAAAAGGHHRAVPDGGAEGPEHHGVLRLRGVAAVLIFQTISNVGMCLFVLPVIGLTLPFFQLWRLVHRDPVCRHRHGQQSRATPRRIGCGKGGGHGA